MSFFSKIFGSREVREVRRVLVDVRANVKSTYGPLGKLVEAILRAVDEAQRELAPTLGVSLTGTPSQQRVLLFYELLYFFSHLTVRQAVGNGFSEPQIAKLQAVIGPMLASTAVDAFCKHWPAELKKKIQGEFFEKLNDAETEYAQCNVVWSDEEPFSSMSIFGRMANNVAALWEQEQNPAIMAPVLSACIRAFGAMRLKENLKDVAAVIDQVDSDAIEDFWKQ